MVYTTLDKLYHVALSMKHCPCPGSLTAAMYLLFRRNVRIMESLKARITLFWPRQAIFLVKH